MQPSDLQEVEDIPEEIPELIVGSAVDETESGIPQADSSVQIGPGAEQVKEEEADENVGIELGDVVEFHSNRADIETVKGRVYYIDESRISILEEGKSRKLVVFDLEQDEEGNWGFLPEYELTGADIKEKRLLPSFIAQSGMVKDMMVETFTAEGEELAKYTIQTLNEQEDTATLVDEAGETLVLDFDFKGIPRDRSVAPFDVLRVIEPPKKEEPVIPDNAPVGEVTEEFLDFEFLDDMEAPDVDEMEVAGLFQATQKPVWLQVHNDDDQINDMLRERIREMDPASQRSTKRIREVTRLVWNMIALRNDTTRYMGDMPVGRKPVTFNTLVELLEKSEFPLAKKVLNVAKAVYLDHSNAAFEPLSSNDYKEDPLTYPDDNILLYYLDTLISQGERYLITQLKDGIAEVVVPGGSTRKIPRWITIWQGFFNKYFNVFTPLRKDDDVKDIKYDQDFFRTEIPANREEADRLIGLPILDADRDTKVDIGDIGRVSFSYMRAIAARYGRYGEAGLTHKIEEADAAEIKGYLLFPLEFMRDLGYIRSGQIALDVALGLTPPKPMKTILDIAGNVVDIPETGKIISVNFDGSSLGNTEISDWLKGQAIYGGGIGNLAPYLRSFGLYNAELNIPQKIVLDTKIDLYRGAVVKMLKDFRQAIQEERKNRKPAEVYPLLENQRAYELFKTITSDETGEPILKELLAQFTLRHPSYGRFDVAKFAYLYIYYPDLLINALAQNPEVAKERLRAERDIFIKQVLDKLAEEKKLQDAGAPPQPNPCQHVKDLNKIRRIQDNSERMQTFNIFVRTFNLKKENHWLWCNNGNPPHHLICEHEFLLLQEFLRPKEKDVIHKEIILNFSGGKFNGQYICKQCGQPIAEYEYDNHLEFNDNGVPSNVQGEVVDEEALEEEALMDALIPEMMEDEDKEKSTTDEEKIIFSTINELAALVGIFPDMKSYEQMISRVKNALALVPDRKKYAASQSAAKAKGKATTDYDVFISRIHVSLCAAALLIDVQTHIPDYVVRYIMPGCNNPSFTGYPRDPDATKPLTGMEYLACAISSMSKKSYPWESTGYQMIKSSQERMKEIMFYLKTFTEQISETNDVQQSIIDKKQYLLQTFGYESALGRPRDIIPYGFTPAPFIPTKELAAEAEAPTIVESASEAEKVRAYIKQAHIYALKYGKYMKGISFSETSCCYNELLKPAEFWKAKGNMPVLPDREPPQGSHGSLLYVHMVPRKLEQIFGKADGSIMYRLFMRVCFTGPRVGQQHEPGYNNICPWCKLKFPDDPRMPPPTRRYAKDGGKQKKYDDEFESELKKRESNQLGALKEVGINEITTSNFEELLNSVNQRSLIPITKRPDLPTPMDNLRGMLSLRPPPFEKYEEILRETLLAVEALPPDAKRTEVINAFASLSNQAVSLENEIQSRLGDANFVNYQELVKLPPQELGEALRTYVLVPFQRILLRTSQEFNTESKVKIRVGSAQSFAKETINDLQEAFKRHTSYLSEIAKDIKPKDVYIKAKMKEVVNRLAMVIPLFIKVLRPTIVRGGAVATTYLQRAIVAGIFAEFIMPNHVPSNEPGIVLPTATITIPAKLPAKILQACLLKFKEEGLAYSEEQIREMIQDRIEKEKAKIIKDKNEMTPEQRKLDNLLQRYGMGKWAVGGTKAIWRYDPNQYVSEGEAMAAAGITRFGTQMDVYEREGGYNVEQTTEDNA